MFLVVSLWILIGFFTRLDNNQDSGCLIHSAHFFKLDNIIFSSISLFIIILSWIVKDKLIKSILLVLELIYFISKLLIIKGGYATGIVGAPQDFVVLYDYIAILIRMLIFLRIINLSYRFFIIEIVSIFIISIKIFYPYSTEYFMRKVDTMEAKKTIIKLNGKWTGNLYYTQTLTDTILPTEIDSENSSLIDILASSDTAYILKKDTIILKPVQLEFDSINVQLKSVVVNENLILNMVTESLGYLNMKNDSIGFREMWIYKLTADSLVVDLSCYDYLYKLKVKKNNAY